MNCFGSSDNLAPNHAYAFEESSSRSSYGRDYVKALRRQMIDEVLPILRDQGEVERKELAGMIGEKPGVLDEMARYGSKYIIRKRLHVGYVDSSTTSAKDMVTVFSIHPDLR